MSDFNVEQFLTGLDAIFDRHAGEKEAEPYLLQAMTDAENAGDDAGLLTVLNETLGFYRSQGRHKDNQWIVQRTLELALRMGLEGTEAWATTLINCATAMRAAGCHDQAADLYQQALDYSVRVFGAHDRRVAALHNNLSMLHSETGHLAEARRELEQALDILESSSPDPTRDIDVASTHTNLALVLLQEADSSNVEAEQASAATDSSPAANCHVEANPLDGSNKAPLPDSSDARKEALNQPSDNTHVESSNVEAELLGEAARHAEEAVTIYNTDESLKRSSHYASALAGLAQVRYAQTRYADAVSLYEQALAIIAECYGTDTDYYRTTDANLRQARAHLPADPSLRKTPEAKTLFPLCEGDVREADRGRDLETDSVKATSQSSSLCEGGVREADGGRDTAPTPPTPPDTPTPSDATTPSLNLPGLTLAQQYWLDYGRPMLAERYPDYVSRIAAGLVGHGSECYGFDDAISRDHDFGPRFCLWLTDEDYDAVGERLQADYDALPKAVYGFGTDRKQTPRARGANRRDGVFRIGDFFESITGYRQAPPADRPHEWLLLDEATLAAATNGEVFADPLGAFSATRQAFKDMPEDVLLNLISRRLGMMAQTGQYNFPRMLERQDGAGAWMSLAQFADAASSLVFLVNRPITVGYAPYYKWRFAALRRLSSRIATRLADVGDQLETVMRLASAACYGGAGFGEGGKGAAPAVATINGLVESIAGEVVAELRHEGLTDSDETFLEWQRPYVESHIQSDDPALHSL